MALQRNQRFEIECFLLAGKLLMQSGAETFRVEDTMQRMAVSQGYTEAVSYVTPTGILFSPGHDTPTKIVQIMRRSIDLDKISRINDISRSLAANQMTLKDAYEALRDLEHSVSAMHIAWQLLFAAIASGSFVILFQGTHHDMPAAAVAGGLGYIAFLLFHRATRIKFFAEFMAALVVGCVAVLATRAGLGFETSKIIIGAVMPLVPGVPIVNAVRDLMAGHMVSGITKGVEGLLTALSIGAGVAVVLSL